MSLIDKRTSDTLFPVINSLKIKAHVWGLFFMSKKLNYEEVKHFIEVGSKSGCKLVSKEYTSNRTKLTIKCKCGEIFETSYNTFRSMNKRQCNKCGKEILINKIKIPLEDIINELSKTKPNIEVIEEYRKDNKYYLKCRCKIDGYVWNTSKSHILNDSNCPKCSKNVKLTLEEVKEKIENINPDIEILSTEYKNSSYPLKCKCKIDGNIFFLSYSDLKEGHGCRKCYERKYKGENHPRWNSNLTQEERERGRDYPEYTQFIKNVLKRDNYTCQCCGKEGNGHNLRVHHLNGYNWCKEERTELYNGITLCKDCHKIFHKLYGKGNNTKEQFEEFIKNIESA